MRQYTPINEARLKSKEVKEFLKTAKKMRGYAIENIHVPRGIFGDLLESISPSVREDYTDGIPFEGKLLVRK